MAFWCGSRKYATPCIMVLYSFEHVTSTNAALPLPQATKTQQYYSLSPSKVKPSECLQVHVCSKYEADIFSALFVYVDNLATLYR